MSNHASKLVDETMAKAVSAYGPEMAEQLRPTIELTSTAWDEGCKAGLDMAIEMTTKYVTIMLPTGDAIAQMLLFRAWLDHAKKEMFPGA